MTFVEPILLEPELAELKEREWLREPKTSFIPPASQRLQMPKVVKRSRRTIEVPQKYPSEVSSLFLYRKIFLSDFGFQTEIASFNHIYHIYK